MAAAVDVACAVNTFSVNTSEVMGGKEATRRFKLYRLYQLVKCIEPLEISCRYILPVTMHVASLKVTTSECHLTCVACERMRMSEVRCWLG